MPKGPHKCGTFRIFQCSVAAVGIDLDQTAPPQHNRDRKPYEKAELDALNLARDFPGARFLTRRRCHCCLVICAAEVDVEGDLKQSASAAMPDMAPGHKFLHKMGTQLRHCMLQPFTAMKSLFPQYLTVNWTKIGPGRTV